MAAGTYVAKRRISGECMKATTCVWRSVRTLDPSVWEGRRGKTLGEGACRCTEKRQRGAACARGDWRDGEQAEQRWDMKGVRNGPTVQHAR